MFETNEADARKFIDEVATELNHPENPRKAIRVVTAVLHTVRDMLTPEESLHLIAQLPLYIKGIYVTGWRLGEKQRIIDEDDFIERLLLQNERTGPHDFGNDEKAMANTNAVIRVLKRRVSEGLIDKIMAQFPVGLKRLWLTDEIVASPM